MSVARRRRPPAEVLLIAFLVVTLPAIAWYMRSPTYTTATPAAVRAKIDPRLLATLPVIPGADARYQQLLNILGCQPVDQSQLSAFLAKGGFAIPDEDDEGDRPFDRFIRSASAEADTFLGQGDLPGAIASMTLALKLLRRMESGSQSLSQLDVCGMDELMLNVSLKRLANAPVLTKAQAANLLKLVPPSSEVSLTAKAAVIAEFQRKYLDWLPDPQAFERKQSEGTEGPVNYDALQTTALFNTVYAPLLDNCDKSLMTYDHSGDDVARRVQAGLPDYVGGGLIGERLYIARLRMTPNGYGRLNVPGHRSFSMVVSLTTLRSSRHEVRAALLARLQSTIAGALK